MINTFIAHYQITSTLGSGGMGEVYRATDTKLGREVAIKVLPPAFAEKPDHLARLRREAQVLASLNHPNIAAIYGLEEAGDANALVLELVEGETLEERLRQGPLRAEKACEICQGIACALEAAHAKGIVHRDLKPANVKITPEGSIKVLDFGIAKATLRASNESKAAAEASDSDTTTAELTLPGTVLGTGPYLSPEQARAQDADERSDIWALGCVLWECLVGRRAFIGATLPDTIAAILHEEPDWRRLPKGTPPMVSHLLRRCLAKDRRNRLHHIADARIELGDEAVLRPSNLESARDKNLTRTAIAAALLLILAAGLFTYAIRVNTGTSGAPRPNPLAGAQFSVIADTAGSEFGASISPDGELVAYLAESEGQFDLFVSQISAGEPRNLTQGGNVSLQGDVLAPVRHLGFTGDGSEIWLGGGPDSFRIQKLPWSGGPARHFLGEDVISLAWSPDGEQLAYFENSTGDPVFVADRDGLNSRLLVVSESGLHQHFPTWSMDGQWLYVVRGRPTTLEMDLWRVRLKDRAEEQLTHDKLDVRYPTPLDERTVLYSARDANGRGPWLWALDVKTRHSQRVSIGLDQYTSIAANADKNRMVAAVQQPRAKLWTVPIQPQTATELDAKPYPGLPAGRAMAPRFGGDSLFFLSSTESGNGLWRMQGGRITEVWPGRETGLLEPAAVSPDGSQLVMLLRQGNERRLHLLSADGAERRVLSDRIDARGTAAWSPSGEWIVCGGSQGGVNGLYKIPVKGGDPVRLRDGEALNPVWSPKGDLIVYAGAHVSAYMPVIGVRPESPNESVDLPDLKVKTSGERVRFLPDGSGLIVMQGLPPSQDFWHLDLTTMDLRQITQLDPVADMRSFDVSPDGRHIVFDRINENSKIVLIDLNSEPRF